MQNSSPVPDVEAKIDQEVAEQNDSDFPLCPSCSRRVGQIKWLDYEDVRLVFHAGVGCVLGVMPVKKAKKLK